MQALAEGGENIPLEQVIADYEKKNKAYSIDLKPEASKKLNFFDKETHRWILKAIIALADNTRPS